MLGKIRTALVRLLVFLSTPLEDERTAIWSIPTPLVPVYFLVFIGISVWTIYEIALERSALYCGLVWTVQAASERDCLITWNALIREVAAEYVPSGIGYAIGTLIAMHGVAGIMALYQFLTNTLTKPAIERQRAKGRAEANREWQEWNQRRMNAEAEGQPFDEPPPSES